ncbi:diacylglycerol O-acyltransferase 2-like [Rhinatrema bivittatum]|uniref:diacylglycerol O-acyltransferase 2-like n=1 Tax=Rhinatrema bivittatum TaxID=194408 RepID=UPI00112CF09C|nr:diacylglycerol O-acyltransferase 2-like [Rhinatrema bivittatum]
MGTTVEEKNIGRSQQLQLLSVLQWILTFLLLGPSCVFLVTCLLFTCLWPLLVLYCIWWIIDWKTPEKGGRKSQWMSQWAVWKHFKNYFPVKLLKTADLVPSENYILGYHPHGIMSIGAFCNFGTDTTGFSKAFPGVTPYLTTLNGNFRVPVYRDYLLAAGMCSVNKSSINYLLSRNGTGNAVVIVVGGAAEALNCNSKQHILTLKNRKGFIKMALAHGIALVPVYSFGENEIFNQYQFEDGSWKRNLQKLFQEWIGFAPCVFIGRGIFSSTSTGLLPFQKPINTVVGKPIPVPKTEKPSDQQIEKYHRIYIRSLMELFNTHKINFGLSETDTLTII